MKNSLFNSYQEFLTVYSSRKKILKRQLNFLVLFRVIAFLVMIYGTYKFGSYNIFLGIGFFILSFGLFIFLINRHLKRKYYFRINENLIEVNRSELEALRGNYSNIENGQEFIDPHHEYSNDFEVFGEGGLFHYLNRTSTYSGKNQLASWLINPLQSKHEIYKRQEAIEELKSKLEWRQKFTAIGKIINASDYDDANLVSWSKEQHHLPRESFLRLFIYLSPLLILSTFLLNILGLIPIGYTIILLLANRGVLFRYARHVNLFHQSVTNQLKVLQNYSRLFRHIEGHEFKSKDLSALKKELTDQHIPASRIINKLHRITGALDGSSNIFIEAILNTIFLYNIHLVFRLESWHKNYAGYIEKWLIALGCFDAYNSLGNYAYNNPDSVFPQVDEDIVLDTKNMGHPLIDEDHRVCNDFKINKKGEVFIITGANMAGKSTFLRTLGVNLVLAMAGAPVCADFLSFRLTKLFTSMNISDSLSKNESYFYAEVKRLRQLVDQASSVDNILVLLDEILTGTNTHDKEIASKAFLERLIEMNVTSIIATHDLSLTSLENSYPETIHNNSFEVDLVSGEMKYDYKIREGVAKNMNALELLKSMKLIR